MLDKLSLKDYVGDFNAYQTEKDYLQHIVLWRIYQSISDELIFKGGTALQKAYNTGRFSEDLDFTASSEAQKDTGALTAKIDSILNKINDFYKTSYTKSSSDISLSYKLKMEGPLYEKPQSIQTILLDISARDQIILKPDTIPISPVYMDIGNYVVKVMNKEEILAEKVRAIMTRRKARDMYDIYFLVSKKVRLRPELAEEKLSYYQMKYSKKALLSRLSQLEAVWETELHSLIKNVPPFKPVLKYITDAI